MTTPSGTISLNDVNVELGLSGTTLITMNDTNVRTLAGVGGSGTIITMQNLQGKSNRVALSYTFSSNTQNASLNLSGISGYSAGKTDFTVTINSGVYLWTDSTGSYGLNITGGTTGDTLTIVNNGYIMGRGGASGRGNGSGTNPQAGGPALNLGFGMSGFTLNHTSGTGYIGGGGGGGGGYFDGMASAGGGAGAGGGGGGGAASGGSIGSTGAIGNAGSAAGAGGGQGFPSGGGGGRIFPGNGGAGGSCGGGGGAGGGSNNPGANMAAGQGCGGGGGGWGASGGNGGSGGGNSGAAGGKAINTNGKSVSYVSGNNARVWGAVS